MPTSQVPSLVSRSRLSGYRERQRQGLLRSWQPGGAHDLRFRQRPVDADTLRARAMHDRKGRIVLAGVIQTALGPKDCLICHSTAGRTDQFDLIVDGRVEATVRGGLVLEILVALCSTP